MAAAERWIVVTNRLPFEFKPETEQLEKSSGGVVSAICGIQAEAERLWVGAIPVANNAQAKRLRGMKWPEISGIERAVPVFLPDTLYDKYYNGMANGVIWPLFHYESTEVEFTREQWQAYVEVNKLFAKEIVKIAKPNDLIWVHDYQLLLLPQFIKEKMPDVKIGFFLHVPFPSSEIFRQLPVRAEVLKGVLKADLIGFHDYSYLRHFCSCLQSVLGLESSMLSVESEEHRANLGVFQVSIDTQRIEMVSGSEDVIAHAKMMKEQEPCEKIILGVDRLDYIKGIDLKLKAFRYLLETNPRLRGKVSLIQIAVPTRPNVDKYITLKESIEQAVGEINGAFGTPEYVPIRYIYNSVDFRELIALYRMADVLLVTSKRDGMNLVALEYIAAQDPEDPGVVVLSEFAGAVSTLSDIVSVNPWDRAETAEAIEIALDKPKEKRIKGNQRMLAYLEKYNASAWAMSLMKSLHSMGLESGGRQKVLLPHKRIMGLPKETRERIEKDPLVLFLDFDGTLVGFQSDPEAVMLSGETGELIQKMSEDKQVEICIISGRDSNYLTKQFGDLAVNVGGEHGAKFWDRKNKKWIPLVQTDLREWYENALTMMRDYHRRVPGSLIEEKDYSVSFHYRASPKEFAQYQARKLVTELEEGLSNFPMAVLRGDRVVEARSVEGDKGTFCRWFLQNKSRLKNPIVVAIGDDLTDEYMFSALPPGSLTIKVGLKQTAASFKVKSQEDVAMLLQRLVEFRGLA